MSKKTLYRITFANQDAVYEIYARKICESEIFGFLEVEEFVFGENTSLVVDPSEERLKVEFTSVKRTFIPMHAVFRIDEVSKQGVAKVRDKVVEDGKVSMFPVPNKRKD
ncbi:DUF1820 family protein [Legionella jamestowniensis]|uniref:DUF1820 domain-containing protein n=1 Tax=Legionella jamestowniensis TaxID=455 RepID=A0A0W0UK91_9GAMM|nr:DUF1820 family protein [Legionella jamestowniensis]KTD08229.1 hypothetical protein Ljam_2424 [Legionella jamestowniensis]OCH98552.1 hypothetical protein A8135_00470 [Legionella jamestowniensis]SFL98165.1 hypothetical protein SAMN02746073_2870 [Legionella jamestowniensis DSM 19215]